MDATLSFRVFNEFDFVFISNVTLNQKNYSPLKEKTPCFCYELNLSQKCDFILSSLHFVFFFLKKNKIIKHEILSVYLVVVFK